VWPSAFIVTPPNPRRSDDPTSQRRARQRPGPSSGRRYVGAIGEPRKIDLPAAEAVTHDEGVFDREADVAGTRWALVEYSPGSGRDDWCETPHAGYVVSGTITYSFEDDRDPLVIAAGEAFALPESPRHRGRNHGAEPALLFLIDALPGG
jgi:quercetin dioxygenase-like cupin family protein